MTTVRRMTLELIAPIDDVWSALAAADGWPLTPDEQARIDVVGARAPDRVSWHVTGRVLGTVEWELDDLDQLTFAYGAWELEDARALRRRSEKAAQRVHDDRASEVARRLATAVGADLLTVRSDMRRPRPVVERPHRVAGAMLLGAAWLSSRDPGN